MEEFIKSRKNKDVVKSLRALHVFNLGHAVWGARCDKGPVLNPEQYQALRTLEIKSPWSSLDNNVRLAKLRPKYISLLKRGSK